MNKIGLVTFYRDNYGSALQCYATKYTLQKHGIECEVIYKNKTVMERIGNKMLYRWRQICDSKLKNVKVYLTPNSRQRIDHFVEEHLAPIGYSQKELKSIGKTDEYLGFITGSDQVWNLNNHPDGFYFLSFASSSKKLAFAVSMGAEHIRWIQEKKIRHFTKDFSSVSVREETAKNILEKACDYVVEVVSDPTIMLTPNEWKDFSKGGFEYSEEYVFAHFIDKPSELAVELINKLEKKNYKIVSFGYKHEELSELEDINGDPRDYVALISKATMVLTDSFHTTLFSIYFKRDFRVFNRNYQSKHSQNSRISYLLNLYGYTSVYDNAELNTEIKSIGCDCIIETQREKTIKQLGVGIQGLF